MTALRRRWSAPMVLLAAGAFAVALALSIAQGPHQHLGQDFHVFWQAGRNFPTGHPLYHDSLPGARPLKYPPFAAFVFQPLALFPLQVAVTLFSLLNLALWVVAVLLTRQILERSLPAPAPGRLPIVLAVVFTAQFFLDNFHHVQMNGVVFVLVLLGVRAYLPAARSVAALLVVAMAVTGLSGRDLTGNAVYLSVAGYSVYAWTILALFAAAAVLAGHDVERGRNTSLSPA